jgi:hypothetical protein
MDNGRLEAQFRRIVDAIEQRQSDRLVTETFETTRALCAEAAAHASGAAARTLFANVHTALETWHTVWPRLGAQKEFRQAVAREAALWARKLGQAQPSHD